MAHEHPDVTGNIDVISDSEVRLQVFLRFLNRKTKFGAPHVFHWYQGQTVYFFWVGGVEGGYSFVSRNVQVVLKNF